MKKLISRRAFLKAVGASSVAAALAACGSSSSSSSEAGGATSAASTAGVAEPTAQRKVLRFGQAAYGDTLDMQISTGSLSASLADEITESLLRFDDDNNEEPVLITDFPTVSEDGTVYSFELKPGVYFTNGTELHSSDVKFTFERMFTPATGAKSYTYFDMIVGAKEMLAGDADELAGIEIQDDYNFTVTLEYAFAPFVKNLGTSYANIFPQDACTEAGDLWGVDENLVGTGPYILESNDPNTKAVLIKNENYHGGDVPLDEIDVYFYSDDTTKLLAYENDDIDVCDLSASLLGQYKDSYADEITTYYPLGTAFLSVNLEKEGLDDVNVRRALSLALNREDLVAYTLDGAGIPATTYLNPSIPGHDDSLPVYEYNVEQARELLAQAGYPDGITISGGEVRQSEQRIAEAVQGLVADAGISLVFDVVDSATWSADRTSGDLVFTFITWNALYPDADFQVYNYFYSTNSDSKSVHYNNPEFDALMDAARVSTSEDERAELYREADAIMSHQDYACIPLYYPQSQFLAKPYVVNMKVGNLIYHLWNVSVDLDAQAAYNA